MNHLSDTQRVALMLLKPPFNWGQQRVAEVISKSQQLISIWKREFYGMTLNDLLVKNLEGGKVSIRYVGDTTSLEYIDGKQQIQSFMRKKYDHQAERI